MTLPRGVHVRFGAPSTRSAAGSTDRRFSTHNDIEPEDAAIGGVEDPAAIAMRRPRGPLTGRQRSSVVRPIPCCAIRDIGKRRDSATLGMGLSDVFKLAS